MKKIFTFLAAVILTVNVYAQSPEKMSYQAVIRNTSNNLVTNHDVGMQISILQGSTSGTAIYVETQVATTNANGLVSIEIGGGTVISGNFSTIDWSAGPYFIKTETDLAGGTGYTITGTSQLLSVPYALHAKTAESITGGITETDPIFNASVAKKITASDTAKWTTSIHKIGDSYGGGIVFYVDATGQHGLIAAKTDYNSGIQSINESYPKSLRIKWDNGSSTTTNAIRDGIGAGMYNTERIIANQGAGSYAATFCTNYQGGGYGDWYLPSKYELNLLYLQRTVVGGFVIGSYWSSTEHNFLYVWYQYFYDGLQSWNATKDVTIYVRAIRAF